MSPQIDCHLLDDEHLRKARVLAAGILIYTRAHKRGKEVPARLAAALSNVSPLVYLWHFFAWKLRGFRWDVELGTTDDHKVVIIRGRELLIGDPMTEEVHRMQLAPDQDADALAQGLIDIQEGRVRPLVEIDAELKAKAPTSPPGNAPLIRPNSKFRYH